MLQTLHIQNLALIDELTISFTDGFHILTGETGAGKSIIIDAVNFVLGERASRDIIQSGSDGVFVEASFRINPTHKAVLSIIDALGIPFDTSDELIISRSLNVSGKNVVRVNGVLVNVATLKSISDLLVDIHGQHEHQSLLQLESHIRFLDIYGGADVQAAREKVVNSYKQMQQCEKELLAGFMSEQDREQRKDILSFQISEIENSKLTPGEEEELDAKLRILSNAQHIMSALEQSYEALTDEAGALYALSVAKMQIQNISDFSDEYSNLAAQLNDAYYSAEDISATIRHLKDGCEFHPSMLEEVEGRISHIQALKRKFGANIDEILQFCQKAQTEYDALAISEERRAALESELEQCKTQYNTLASELSSLRKQASLKLQHDLITQMKDLGMENAQFEVVITGLPSPTADGLDKIEFMLSTNIGEPVKPLHKVASGGELSRIMLAFKTILFGEIPTIIFDEIDSGISGHIATAVGQKMLQISHGHQVLCVTHLPQIAAMADVHYYVEKAEKDGHTSSSVKQLDNDGRILELARIMGGNTDDVQAINHAKELITRALKLKNF